MENQEIINRVANSSLVSLDLEDYMHLGERIVYDIKENLFQGMILREKDFRNFLKEHDWASYQGKNVSIICSVDAIVPTWAYMLLTSYLQPHANMVVFGGHEVLELALLNQAFSKIDLKQFKGAKVVIKGCGSLPFPEMAFVEVCKKLQPYVSSILYGEPCSTVPIYKAKTK